MDKFAVIDTETNWDDAVMSVGVVIADGKTFEKTDSVYYIIDPEYRVGGLFAHELRPDDKRARVTDRGQALKEIRLWLKEHGVKKLFAYNAAFDKRHLPEYAQFEWYDIMRLAAYRQYNKAIPACADCCRTGRLKRGYGVESVLRMLSNDMQYQESHNAVTDAEDELEIIRLLGCGLEEYGVALLAGR